MISVDTSSISLMATGAALAASGFLFSKVRRTKERCEFIQDARAELSRAFDAADLLLSDTRIEGPLRSMFLHLLYAHAHPALGREFALAVFEPREPAQSDSNPIGRAMHELGELDVELERLAHRTFMSLVITLGFIHLHDNFEVRKIQSEAALDPISVLVKAWKALTAPNDHGGTGNGNAIPA